MLPTRSLADVQMSGIKYLHLKARRFGSGKESEESEGDSPDSCSQGMSQFVAGQQLLSLQNSVEDLGSGIEQRLTYRFIWAVVLDRRLKCHGDVAFVEYSEPLLEWFLVR